MRADAIRAADTRARAGFAYRADLVIVGDNWRSHADDALAGRPWSGDCDDLTSTVFDLLTRAGAGLSGLYRLLVSTRDGKTVDHMVGATWDDAGRCWIIGDTFGACYPAADCAHIVIRYQTLDNIDVWRDGAPF